MSITLRVHLALFLVSLLYGATFVLAKEVMPYYMKPFAFIGLRVSISAVLFFLVWKFGIRAPVPKGREWIHFLICAIFGVAANMLLFFKGLSITKPINASVLMTSTPVFVTILALLFKEEKWNWLRLLGIGIACSAAIMLIGGPNLSFNNDTLQGDVMVALNAIIYAYYLVYVRKLIKTFHPVTITTFSFLIATFLVIPFAWGELGEIDFSSWPTRIWWLVAFIIFGASFLTYLLNAWALKFATPGLVGAYIYLQPLLATLISVIWGKDELNVFKALVSLVLIFGVYLATRKTVQTNDAS